MRYNTVPGLKTITAALVILLLVQEIKAQRTVPSQYPAGIPVNYVRTWDAMAPETDGNALMTRPLKDVKQATQYFDGLGRPLQTVIKQGSLQTGSTATDLVSPIEYDQFGREPFKYLPYAEASAGDGLFKTNPFASQATFMTAQYGTQGETYFYSQTNFEASPLSRVEKSMAPGNSWVGGPNGGRGVEAKYWINTAVDDVKIWGVTNSGSNGVFGSYALNTGNNNGVYAAGTLFKNVTVDEHGKQVIEFKDKEGKVILKKVQIGTTPGVPDDGTGRGHTTDWLCTYYIYDDLNQLRCVIQPEGVKALAGVSWSLTSTQLAEQCFRYEYDQRGRMVMKKVPGAGEVYMVYDGRDRLVMTQDAKLREQGKWMVTKYDNLNRPVETGLWNNSTSFNDHLQAAYNSTSYPATTGTYEILTITHYDDYTGLPSGLSDYLTTWNSHFDNTNNANWPYHQLPQKSMAVKGMATWTQTKVLGTSTFINTVSYYDDKGRVIQMQSINISGGLDVVTTQYSWAGQPLVTVQKQEKAGTNAQTTILVSKLSYDDLGRLVKTEKKLSHTQVNSGTISAYKTTAENEYNKLGQLKKKKLAPAYNNNAGLETLNYDYNIRGWMLGINRDYARDASSDNYFGFDLGYDKVDNNLVGGQTYLNPQYNGNIEGMVWKSKGDGEKRKYDFYYDAVNRLLRGDFTQYTGGSFNQSAGVNYNMKMGDGTDVNSAYDANGNILQMQQWGLKIAGSIQIDNLRYTYLPGSNKLKSVTDFNNEATTKLGDFRTATTHAQYASKMALTPASSQSSFDAITDYTYDVNGNLALDNNKAISSITYNHLNLPSVITVTGKGTISYTYDAAGNKLKKVTVDNTITPAKTTTTDYVGGAVFENDVLQFIGMEEGRIRYKALQGSVPASLQYDYMLKDHLGNVRVVLTEEQQTDPYPPASMETAQATTEEQLYSNLPQTRVDKPAGYPNDTYTDPNDKVARTSGSGNKIGPAMVLKVMSGDKFNLRVNSWYKTYGANPGAPNPITELAGALANNIAGVSGGKATEAELNNSGLSGNAATSFLNSQSYNSSKPKAFVNWIFLDEQFHYYAGGFEQVGDNEEFKTHLFTDVAVNKSGYLYVYVSNETPNIDVFFDNLQVTHIRGPILEETHYYPFGLTMAGISSKSLNFGKEDKYKFNGGTELNTSFNVNLYETSFRSLDPQLGRFWQIDPLTESHPNLTSYSFVGNNPLRYNDPYGLDTIPTTLINGKMNVPSNPIQNDVLKIDNGDGTTSFYTYDPSNPGANKQGYVGTGMDGGTGQNVTIPTTRKPSGINFSFWLDPTLAGAEYQLGKTLDKYRLDGYGRGRPLFPGPSQRVFDRNFPKGSFGNTRPVNIHIPGTGSSIQAPRYIVSATGQIIKFVGISSAVVGTISTEQRYLNGKISSANRWTNHIMTVISFIGPGGLAISLLYTEKFEDAIFKGKDPSFMPESYWEGSLFITF